ncbi:MAG TPA: CoA transferase [Vicinamibacterales bacterium]|nr:CoA transferase [Vicinamibacterales bacterium]
MAPLEGIKVLEIGVAMAGPYCGMLLADYGADVVKIERMGDGDESRQWAPFFADQVSHYFASINRSKRSVAVNLKQADGVAVVRKLASDCDVLVDNFRPGALEELGLGYAALAAENPRLIYCSISGFGANGPLSKQRANDVAIQAFSGGMSITGEPGGSPVKMGISVADIGAGMFGAIGILMALEARHRTGRGQRVDTSLLEGQIAMLSYHVAAYFATGRAPRAMGSAAQGLVPYQAFQAADGWMVVAVFTDRMWRDLCDVISRPEWANDPRFDSPAKRKQNRNQIIPVLEALFHDRPFAYWNERLTAVGIPCTGVNTIDQAVHSEQAQARDLVVELQHPAAGAMQLAGLPIKLADTPGAIVRPPPVLGEHTSEVLIGSGYSTAEIDSLARAGVVQLADASIEAASR